MRAVSLLVLLAVFALSEFSFAAGGGEGVSQVPSPPAFKRATEYLLNVPPDLGEGKEGEGGKKPEDKEGFTPAFIYKRDGDLWGRLEDGTKPTNLTNFAEDDEYKAKFEKAVAEEKEWRKATGGRSGRTPVMLDFTSGGDDGKIYYYLGYVQTNFEFFSLNVDGTEKTPVAKLSLPSLGANESANDEFIVKRRNVVFAFRTANAKLAPLRIETMGIEHLRDYTLSPDAKRCARLWRQVLRPDTQAKDAARRVNDGKGHYLLIDSVRGNTIHGYPLLDVDKANEELPPGGIAIQVPEDPSTGSTSNTNYVSWGLYWSPDGEWIAMLGPQERQGWGGGIEPGGHIVLLKADATDARVYHRWAPDQTWVSTMQARSQPVRWARTPNGTRHKDEMQELAVQYVCAAANEAWQQIGNPMGKLTWSPDSKYLACWARRQEAGAWIVNFAVMRIADGRLVRVNCAPGLGNDYAWSPDGKQIAIEVTCKQRPNRALTQQDIEEMVSAICVADVEALFKGASGDVTVIAPDDERFTKIAVGYKGIGLTWIGPALEQEFVPLELVVAGGSELSDELAGIKRRHDSEVDKLQELTKKLKTEEDNKELLDEIRDVRVTIRFHEEDFFKTAADAMGAYAWGDFDRQSQAFRDRVIYLQRQAVTWHDTLREYGYFSYVMHFSQYRREEARFRQVLADLNHTLDLWNVYNSMALAHHELMARDIRIQLGIEGAAGMLEEHLAPICRHKARLLLDQGERAVIQVQANREAALYYQRSYFDGIRAAAEKRENVEPLTVCEEAMGFSAFVSQFMLRTIGGGWEALLDSLKWGPGLVPVVGEFFESRADKMDRQVLELRKQTADTINALDEMRAYEDIEFRLLRDELRALEFDEDGSAKGAVPADVSLGEKALNALLTDRFFHEQTDGGLFRIAGAFDVALSDKLSTEYLAALHHARLVVYDIQAATRARMGADVKTGEASWAVMLEPTKNIESIVRGYSGDWKTRGDYLGRRKGHVAQMHQMATFWRQRNYAFEAYEHLPGTDAPPGEEPKPIYYEIHENLATSSPDYVNFLIRRAILIHDADTVEYTIANARRDVPADWERLEDFIEQRRLIMRAQVQVMRTRALRLEAADRLMTWDYDGCIACMKEACCIDPMLQVPRAKDPARPNLTKEILERRRFYAENIKEVEDALRWEKLLDNQIASFREVGQQGFMTALIGGACQGITLPGSLAEAGGQIWKFGATMFKFTGKEAWKGFALYAVQEVDPFFVTDARSMLGLLRTSSQMVAAEAGSEIAVRSLESLDVDTEWLRPWIDKLAIVLVAHGTRRVEEAYAGHLEQLCGDIARRIEQLHKEHAEAQKKGEVDVGTYRKLEAARDRLLSWAAVLKLIDAIYYEAKGLESEYRLMQADAAVRKGLFKSHKEYLHYKTRKLTPLAIDYAYSRYKVAEYEARAKGFDPDAAVALFKKLPIDSLRAFKASDDYFAKHPDVELGIDAVRCKLADYGRQHVASKYKAFCRYIVVSGTPPGNREYRLLDSDNDYTMLLRTTDDIAPEQRQKLQAEIEAEYIGFFKTTYDGFDPERCLDSNLFCDWMPSKQAIRDINEYMEEFHRNVQNPERYILPDCLQFIPLYLYRKAGVLQEVQADGSVRTLKGAEAEAVFGDVELHESMGAQIILDQYRFNLKYYGKLMPGVGEKGIEPHQYLKAQAKYNLRSLLGYNLTDALGLRRHNEFEASEDYTLHKSIVEIAKETRPDDPELHLLADEWFALKTLKTGGSWEAVFETRMRRHGLPDLQSAVNEHLRMGEEYIGKFLKEALRVQARHMAEKHALWWDMHNAPDHAERMATDEEYVRTCRQAEYDYWSHACSQGYIIHKYGLEPGAVERIVEIEPSAKRYFTPEDENVIRLSRFAADRERQDEDAKRLRRIWGD